MTDPDLLALLALRRDAYARLGFGSVGGYNRPLADLSPAGRADADAASADYRSAGSAVVAELKRRGRPAHLRGVTLALTADGLHYAECEPGTLTPRGVPAGAWVKAIVNQYGGFQPTPRLRRRGEP